MRSRAALLAAMWLAAVVLATVGVTAVLILVGGHMFGPSVHSISQAQVSQELARHRAAAGRARPAPGPATSPVPSPATTPAATARTYSAGTVFASCSAGLATLTQRIPAQGYQIDEVSAGPAATASVRFSSGQSRLLVTVSCRQGQPVFTSSAVTAGDNDEHHGGRGGGGGGRGGGTSGGP
jgi:uncharacterized membrane protein YgcG